MTSPVLKNLHFKKQQLKPYCSRKVESVSNLLIKSLFIGIIHKLRNSIACAAAYQIWSPTLHNYVELKSNLIRIPTIDTNIWHIPISSLFHLQILTVDFIQWTACSKLGFLHSVLIQVAIWLTIWHHHVWLQGDGISQVEVLSTCLIVQCVEFIYFHVNFLLPSFM